MSSHCLVPCLSASAGAVLRLESLELPKALVENRGLLRSMGRAGTLLATCTFGAGEAMLGAVSADPDGVAVYCAADHSTGPQNDLLKLVDRGQEPMSAVYGRTLSPKWSLQSSIGLAAASLSILLGTRGGVHTFHHSRFACSNALTQAQLDLDDGACRLALVCAVTTADDPLTMLKLASDFPARTFAEGVAVLLLAPGGEEISFPPARGRAIHYGIADGLVGYVLGGKDVD